MESHHHLSTNPDDAKISVKLNKWHDEIRQHLFELGFIDNLKGFDSVFVSNWTNQNSLEHSQYFKRWFWELI